MKQVSVRDLQHNLADFLNLAQTIPLSITKYGKDKVVIVNPEEYTLVKKKSKSTQSKNLASLAFIGMHKDKKSWKDKTSQKIAQKLRENAWYGK